MARDSAYIEAAKQKRTNTINESRIYNLPPGYFKGFKLSLENNQLKVGKGILSHRGNRMEKQVDYILNWEDYIGTVVVRNCTYYIYLCDDGTYKIDVIAPVFNDTHYGWYHAFFANYYYLGRFYFTTAGEYTYLVSGDVVNLYDIPTGSITTDRMYTDFLQSLFLQTDTIVLGYVSQGTGTYASPEEGDTMMYLSGNTILRAERISGAWIAKMILGTLTAGAFAAVLGACMLCHPDNPPTSFEYLPNPNFRVFNFENNYQDQNGLDDWSFKIDSAFSSTYKKFGSYSLYAADTKRALLAYPSACTSGNDQTIISWVKCSASGGEAVAAKSLSLFGMVSTGGEDRLFICLNKKENSNDIVTRAWISKRETVTEYIDTKIISDGDWHYIGLVYKVSINTAYLIIDTTIIGIVPSEPWLNMPMTLAYYPCRNYVYDSVTWNSYIDEVLCYQDKYLDPNLLAQHYTHNTPWITGGSQLDIFLRPGEDGRVYTEHEIKTTNAVRSTLGYLNALGEYNYAWHKVANPTVGYFAQKTDAWNTDNFTTGFTVDFSSVVTAGTIAVRCFIYIACNGAGQNLFYRKYGDTNISNTPNASTEWSCRIARDSAQNGGEPIVLYLSTDYKVQFASLRNDPDIYISYPIEELR